MSKELELLPCPFCGSRAVIELGKRESCQLHGEPFQGVVIRCKKHECFAKPKIEADKLFYELMRFRGYNRVLCWLVYRYLRAWGK